MKVRLLLWASCIVLNIEAHSRLQAQAGPVQKSSARPPVNGTKPTYATVALEALIGALSSESNTVPPALRAYRASVESEVAAVVRIAQSGSGVTATTAGANATPEHVVQVDQIASTVQWQRDGTLEQHVTGYRFSAIGGNIASLSYFRKPWIVPVLYGNRLQALFGKEFDAAPVDGALTDRKPAAAERFAVHPFASDRNKYYVFSGGDTAAVIHVAGRQVPIVRVMVEPLPATYGVQLLFRGEVDVDAERHQIVRMHGQFVVQRASPSLLRRAIQFGLETVAFADFTNGEYDGQFWLPTEQRIELQARSRLEGDSRPIVRIVSRFSDYVIAHDSMNRVFPHMDSARRTLSFAPNDSLNAFTNWQSELGNVTSDARAEDFDDVAPESWSSSGGFRVDLHAQGVSEVARFNRVEGVFLGGAAVARFRNKAPGLEIGGNVGWAAAERTSRGALWGGWFRSRSTFAIRTERELASTNDLRPLIDGGASLPALLGTVDDYDYVDRRSFRVLGAHTFVAPIAYRLRAELGVGDDRGEHRRIRYGLIHLDSAFRENRAVTPGSYVRSVLAVDVHPNVSGEFLEPGVGYGVWYERGDGTLRWQRLEARLAVRHVYGPVSYAGHINAAAVFTRQVLPQQMIEIGQNEGLPGYAYKEFGGNHAVLANAGTSYGFPFLRSPIHFGQWSRRLSRIYFPGVTPTLVAGIQGGWSEATTAEARTALALFGTRIDSASTARVLATRPTDGIRSTASLTLRLFGGAFGVGVAHPLSANHRDSRWRFSLGGGQSF